MQVDINDKYCAEGNKFYVMLLCILEQLFCLGRILMDLDEFLTSLECFHRKLSLNSKSLLDEFIL